MDIRFCAPPKPRSELPMTTVAVLLDPRAQPQLKRNRQRIDIGVFLPRGLATMPMQLAVTDAALVSTCGIEKGSLQDRRALIEKCNIALDRASPVF